MTCRHSRVRWTDEPAYRLWSAAAAVSSEWLRNVHVHNRSWYADSMVMWQKINNNINSSNNNNDKKSSIPAQLRWQWEARPLIIPESFIFCLFIFCFSHGLSTMSERRLVRYIPATSPYGGDWSWRCQLPRVASAWWATQCVQQLLRDITSVCHILVIATPSVFDTFGSCACV